MVWTVRNDFSSGESLGFRAPRRISMAGVPVRRSREGVVDGMVKVKRGVTTLEEVVKETAA